MTDISWDAIIGIAGVIVGIALSQLIELAKATRRRGIMKKALRSELETIKKTILSAISAQPSFIKADEFPLITKTYDSVNLELASVLPPDQIAAIHRAYEEIKKLNGRRRTVANFSGYLYDKDDLKAVLEIVNGLKGL